MGFGVLPFYKWRCSTVKGVTFDLEWWSISPFFFPYYFFPHSFFAHAFFSLPSLKYNLWRNREKKKSNGNYWSSARLLGPSARSRRRDFLMTFRFFASNWLTASLFFYHFFPEPCVCVCVLAMQYGKSGINVIM